MKVGPNYVLCEFLIVVHNFDKCKILMTRQIFDDCTSV